MRIVGELDIHRRQITFDYLDERSGETRHGRIAPADRASVAPGFAPAAVGAVRGSPVRRPPRLSRSRLLPAGRRPGRRLPGRPVGGPQDGPPGAPHPAPSATGPSHRSDRRSPGARICPPTDARGPLQLKRCRPCLAHGTALKDRAAARPAGQPHRSSCRRSRSDLGCAHRDKAGRPRTTPLPLRPPAPTPDREPLIERTHLRPSAASILCRSSPRSRSFVPWGAPP
jgi:hypothetical protein